MEGKEEHEVVQEAYLGKSSRSVVFHARKHYRDNKLGMKKTARSTPSSSNTTAVREEGREEEGSSWMADHAISHNGGDISANPTKDYDFFVVGSWKKPLHRQLEEGIRIRKAKNSGILNLGRGKTMKTMIVKKKILNRKLENFSPFFLTMGGGEDYYGLCLLYVCVDQLVPASVFFLVFVTITILQYCMNSLGINTKCCKLLVSISWPAHHVQVKPLPELFLPSSPPTPGPPPAPPSLPQPPLFPPPS